MVIIPGSMATPNGLTFTIGQITWTTGPNDLIATITEEARIQSASTAASPASATASTTVDTAPTTVDLAPTTVDLASTTVDLALTTVDPAPTMPAMLLATPTIHRSLPRYKGRQIDNTDLLDSIDRVGTKLAETLALVTTIHNRSTRPAQASRPARLSTDLVVMSTPKGRFVHC